MDATQRWETEALRSGSLSRKTPPRPPAQQPAPETGSHDDETNWVTLKEAEAATGIPVNTLRKWSRKSAVASYLESDGDMSLRMVDLDAVIAHALDLGRNTVPVKDQDEQDDQEDQDEREDRDDSDDEGGVQAPPEGTLIVPLDAWNRMLNQLGNLHEAGQQLAEARERAAKAETEALFLRERLAEMRAESAGEHRTQSTDAADVPLSRGTAEGRSPDAGGSKTRLPPSLEDSLVPPKGGTLDSPSLEDSPEKPTTSYWRYLTFGWRDRKRRSSKKRP